MFMTKVNKFLYISHSENEIFKWRKGVKSKLFNHLNTESTLFLYQHLFLNLFSIYFSEQYVYLISKNCF